MDELSLKHLIISLVIPVALFSFLFLDLESTSALVPTITYTGPVSGSQAANMPLNLTIIGTYAITVNTNISVTVKGAAGGGGGSRGNAQSIYGNGGGGGGGGAANISGFPITLLSGVTYIATVGSGGAGDNSGGVTELRISGGSVLFQLGGGQGASFTYVGGMGGCPVIGGGLCGGRGGKGTEDGGNDSQAGISGVTGGGGGAGYDGGCCNRGTVNGASGGNGNDQAGGGGGTTSCADDGCDTRGPWSASGTAGENHGGDGGGGGGGVLLGGVYAGGGGGGASADTGSYGYGGSGGHGVMVIECSSGCITTYAVVASIASGSGTISASGISCPGDCSETYPAGTWVTLIATPAAGFNFTGWASGAGTICATQTSTCSAYIDGDKTVSANFAPDFNYTISAPGSINMTKSTGNISVQNIVTKTLSTGTGEPISLSVSGLPSGVSLTGLSGQGCVPNPTCQGFITLSVAPIAPVGTHVITVTSSTADGTPTDKTITFNLIISASPFSVTCSASPSNARLGQPVTWNSVVSGGTPPFSYAWSGTNIPTSPAPSGSSYVASYSTTGQKQAFVTVTSQTDSNSASCSTVTANINFDPQFREF